MTNVSNPSSLEALPSSSSVGKRPASVMAALRAVSRRGSSSTWSLSVDSHSVTLPSRMSVTNFSRILYSSESFAKTAPPPCERSPSGFTKMSGWSRTWMSAYSRIALMFADTKSGYVSRYILNLAPCCSATPPAEWHPAHDCMAFP